jgi:hypothetical protein
MPEIEAGVCVAGGTEYVCLSGPSAYALGNYIEQVGRYHDDVKSCPYVEELRLPTLDTTPVVNAGRELVK